MPNDQLETELGTNVRALRIAKQLTQVELADLANVSVGALKHLESGSGTTTSTLVRVLRALGEEGWIAMLRPAPAPFNPLEALEARQAEVANASKATRVRRRRARS